MPNFDEIAKVLGIIGTVVGGGVGINKWLEARRKQQRARKLPDGDFPFDVIKPRSPDLLKQIMGGDENNPLADYKIPYQERQPDRSVRQELEAAFNEKNWVLILGKSGLGKTREAAHLADLMNREGWTVLKLAHQSGAWLDVPKEFPKEISPDDKLLFFLDDLNRWMYAGNPHEIHPKAGEELARPLREPVQERLPQLLEYFEQQGKSPYVRVIATARNEHEPDKPGEIAPWDKLQWDKYKSFWERFHCYPLGEPSESAVVNLLTNCVAVADMKGVPAEYGQIARRNDGTFRNITLNLDSAKSRDLAVNNQEFSPGLDQTWRRRYNKVVQLYPLARYGYDAVELLRTLNLWLTAPMLAAITKRLLPGRGLRRWRQGWQLQQTVLPYLITTEQILTPKDGQIEAKKTDPVDVGRYLPEIWQQLAQLAKQDSTYPVATEYFDCGNALYALGRNEEAITSYDQAIAIKPGSHEAWNNRGNALYALGRNEEAIASYDQAITIKPDKHTAWNNRGNALSALGRNEEAITSYDQAIAIKADKYAAWNNRGNALSALERNEEAIASYDQAIAIKPDYHEAWNNRSVALSILERNEEAIASYDQAIAIKPDYHEACYNRGNSLYTLGRKEEAINSYDQAIAIKADYHEAWNNRGVALSALGRKEEAVNSYDQVIAIKADNNEAWNNRGNALYVLGRKEEAVNSYDQAIAIKPDYHEAWNNQGVALSALGRNEEAINSYDQAIAIKADYQEAWNNQGVALSALGRNEEAINSYDQAIAIKADNNEAWYGRGLALSALGRNEEAVNSYDQAIAIKADNNEAWNNRGNALSALGRNEEAVNSYDQAIAIKADYHEAWNNRGVALSALGRNEEAINSYDQALEFSPNALSITYNKACCYALWGNVELALENLQLSLSLDPEQYRELAKTDSDFDGLRDDARFQAVIGE